MRDALPTYMVIRFDGGQEASLTFRFPTELRSGADPVAGIMRALDDKVRTLFGLIAHRYESVWAKSKGRKPRTINQINRAITRTVKP
jgi:hypothetical protein